MFKISYIYDLVDNITPQLHKIQNNLKETASKVNASAVSMEQSFNKVGNKLNDIGKKSSKIGRDIFLKTTVPIGLLGASFIKTASDYQESLNKVDVAFGNSSQSVKNFANTAGKNFGIDRGSALDMAAMFGDMSTGMGLSQTKAADLSTKLVGLAGDLASFKNIGVGEATTALAGIFTGETESLKRLGIVMTEANLEQFALTQGVTKKLNAFTQAEKVLLRYNYIMAMSKNSVGDFARTQEGFANQQRILSSRFKDLSITLGTILLPYAIKLVNIFIKIIEKFQELSPRAQKIILILAGLVAVIAPLFIAIGFIASGVSALIASFAFLAPLLTIIIAGFAFLVSPVGLITIAVIGLIAAIYLLRDSFVIVYDFLKDNLLAIFDAIALKIESIGTKINEFRSNAASILSSVGLEGAANFVAPEVNQNINKPQQMTAGGQLDVNIKGLPKGSNAGFTPKPNNFLPVGLNTVYGGA